MIKFGNGWRGAGRYGCVAERWRLRYLWGRGVSEALLQNMVEVKIGRLLPYFLKFFIFTLSEARVTE